MFQWLQSGKKKLAASNWFLPGARETKQPDRFIQLQPYHNVCANWYWQIVDIHLSQAAVYLVESNIHSAFVSLLVLVMISAKSC